MAFQGGQAHSQCCQTAAEIRGPKKQLKSGTTHRSLRKPTGVSSLCPLAWGSQFLKNKGLVCLGCQSGNAQFSKSTHQFPRLRFIFVIIAREIKRIWGGQSIFRLQGKVIWLWLRQMWRIRTLPVFAAVSQVDHMWGRWNFYRSCQHLKAYSHMQR